MKDNFLQFLSDDQEQNWMKSLEEADQWFAEWIQKLPDEYKAVSVEIIDQLVFGLAQFCHKKSRLIDMERKILIEARLFNEEIETIEDMHKLPLTQIQYIEEKMKSKYTLYSIIEGGLAGTGNVVGLVLDLPALLTINLNMIQSIASSYGYSLSSPPEQILALKVLHAGTLSKTHHDDAWDWLIHEYQKREEYTMYVKEHETIIQIEWLETIAKQWLKAVSLYGLKKTNKKGISLIGVMLGASLNMQFTKQVGQFASSFYQYRFEEDYQHKGVITE